MKQLITVLALAALAALAGCSGMEVGPERTVETVTVTAEPEVVTETVTETVVPQVCLDALDEADNLNAISADMSEVFGEAMGLSAQAVEAAFEWDADRLDALTVELDTLYGRVNENAAAVIASEYAQNRDACIAAATN